MAEPRHFQSRAEFAHRLRGYHRQRLKESIQMVVQRLDSEGDPTGKGHEGGLVQK